MPEERKQHRLEAWVDRELRALLQTDDVAIVRAYVMGLVRGIGFANRQVRGAQSCSATGLIEASEQGAWFASLVL